MSLNGHRSPAREQVMNNNGYAALDHFGAITLAQSIKDMALGAGEFLVVDSDTDEGKAVTGAST